MNRRTVSLCMLTCNNDSTIGIALKSILVLIDEIIIIDIGSSDDTIIIAEGYGARVIERDFDNDYAKMRNIALDEAVCDWILWLDPNEIIGSIKPHDFQTLLHANTVGYNINITSTKQAIATTQELRLFRYHPEVRYQYPVKEQIIHSLRKQQLKSKFDDVKFTEELKIICNSEEVGISSNSQNIISILEKNLAANIHDPYLEYAIACEYISESEGQVIPNNKLGIAIDKLEKARQKAFASSKDTRQELDYLPDLLLKLSACYLASGKINSSWHSIKAVREFYPEDSAIMLQYLVSGVSYLCNIIKDKRSKEAYILDAKLTALIDLLQHFCVKPAHLAKYRGDLELFMGETKKAQTYFKLALEVDSSYSYALLGLAQCQVYLGNKNGAIKFYMAAIQKNKNNHLAWSQGSKLLRKMGANSNASLWQDKVADRFPGFLESKTNK